MLEVMLALGAYRFSLSTAAYQTLQRSAEWRWPAHELIGETPSRQFVGPGRQDMRLTGLVLPHYKGMLGLPNLISRVPEIASALGILASAQSILQRVNLDLPGLGGRPGAWQLEALRQDAERGVPLLMVDGRGRDWGYWVVDSMAENETHHMSHGAALRIEFDIAISYYGDEAPESSSAGSGLLDILRGVIGYL